MTELPGAGDPGEAAAGLRGPRVPVPPFDPASYPGPRPRGPVHVRGGAAARVGPDELTSLVASPRWRWVLAYGSNASPGRLVDKHLDRRGAILLPAVCTGWVPAFEQRRTGYGSVPLTLVPEPGASTSTWLLGVDVVDTGRVDRSEGRVPDGGTPIERDDRHHAPPYAYVLAHVGPVCVPAAASGGVELRLDDAVAYLPGPATRVQVDADGRWRTWPEVDQRAAVAHLDGGGPWRHPPVAERVVGGAWPVAAPVA